MTEKNTNNRVPKCIGIIMDGNRRWARKQGLSTLEGHRRGKEKLKEVAHWVKEIGIDTLIVYAFSTENWNRSPEEVKYLMDILKTFSDEILDIAKKENIRIKFLGQIDRFSKGIQENIAHVEKETENNPCGTLSLCLSYGGRADILHAVKSLPQNEIKDLTEEKFSKYLWTSGLPDPDIIIRTSGEKRLSGFLTWQSVYSELFFVEEEWPTFSRETLERILLEYQTRERRIGK